MKLSLRVWLALCGLCWLSFAQALRAEGKELPEAVINEAWVDALSLRIERMVPVVMSSLAAVRRERDKGLVRCFDRAVAGLNSLQRQVSYHADLRYETSIASERARHTRALVLLSARADELARSVQTCFTDGVPLKDGETVVEVVAERR